MANIEIKLNQNSFILEEGDTTFLYYNGKGENCYITKIPAPGMGLQEIQPVISEINEIMIC